MPTTITAPVPVTHAGESDPAQFVQSIVGAALPDIVGASTTAAGNINVRYSAPIDGIPDVTVTVVAAANAYTTAGKVAYVPTVPGLYTVTVTDVTAGQSVASVIQVFESEGV